MLAVLIVHMRTLEKSLMPWIICSQMVPILAIAPIIIVVFGAIGIRGLFPKSMISAYLCFFPVTIGMVKGLTSPDPIQLDLMRTWSASKLQVLWKLRWPASIPFLFASLKVSVTISLVGAIVAELPTGAQAGIGARLLTGSYYGQTVQIWAALCRRRDHRRRADRHHRRDRERRPRGAWGRWRERARQAIGFWLAALGLLAALALPLAGDAVLRRHPRPPLLAADRRRGAAVCACAALAGTSRRFRACRHGARLRRDALFAAAIPASPARRRGVTGCWCSPTWLGASSDV